MSAAMMFLIIFAAAWLAVAGTTITHLMRPRGMRWDISLMARTGLLVWFTGVIAAAFAEVRHWPAREIGQLNGVGITCKLTGFALLIRWPGPPGPLAPHRAGGVQYQAQGHAQSWQATTVSATGL